MNNYFIAFLLFILSLGACEKEKNEYEPIPINYSQSSIALRVQDKQGIDLLNRKNAGHYRDSEIDGEIYTADEYGNISLSQKIDQNDIKIIGREKSEHIRGTGSNIIKKRDDFS